MGARSQGPIRRRRLLGAAALLGFGAAVGAGRMVFLATPRRLATLMADLLDPAPGTEVYEPGCGNGRLLVELDRRARRGAGGAPARRLRLYAEELNLFSFGLARANARLHHLDAEVVRTDTMRRPAFRGPDGSLRRFELAIADPMWSQRLPSEVYASDRDGRFPFGTPPASNADWGWLQHLYASLTERGRMVVILDAGVATRSSVEGSAEEAAIRRGFVEADVVEAVMTGFWGLSRPRPLVRGPSRRLLPDGVLLVLNRAKRRPGRVLFVDGDPLVAGYGRGRLSAEAALGRLVDIHRRFEAVPGIAAAVGSETIARREHVLDPRLYVA